MWNVSHEGGLRLSKGERSLWDTQPAFREYDYFLQSVEVSSRKLRIKDAWPAELAKVLSIFDELSSDNETFGGHVTPGCGFINNHGLARPHRSRRPALTAAHRQERLAALHGI